MKMNLRHSHNTRFWYLLGMFRNFSTSNHITFFGGEPRVLNHNYFWRCCLFKIIYYVYILINSVQWISFPGASFSPGSLQVPFEAWLWRDQYLLCCTGWRAPWFDSLVSDMGAIRRRAIQNLNKNNQGSLIYPKAQSGSKELFYHHAWSDLIKEDSLNLTENQRCRPYIALICTYLPKGSTDLKKMLGMQCSYPRLALYLCWISFFIFSSYPKTAYVLYKGCVRPSTLFKNMVEHSLKDCKSPRFFEDSLQV